MTAIATVCGMFPLALALGAGSQMLQPLAIAVIGGLSISIVLSLVVTPVVYYHLTRRAGGVDTTTTLYVGHGFNCAVKEQKLRSKYES